MRKIKRSKLHVRVRSKKTYFRALLVVQENAGKVFCVLETP